jgi:hypothetical protein
MSAVCTISGKTEILRCHGGNVESHINETHLHIKISPVRHPRPIRNRVGVSVADVSEETKENDERDV